MSDLLIKLSVASLFIPLLGFIVVLFLGKRLKKLFLFEVVLLGVNTLISIYIVIIKLAYFPAEKFVSEFTWINFASFSKYVPAVQFDLGVMLDNVTVIMLFVVNLISFLVHLFSIEYMHGDKRYSRYFAYLGLFTFSMLGIVLTHNLLMIYIFWELVGVSSYLLIGFWFEKWSAANASKKAMLMNRVGDTGLLLGILILFTNYGTFTFDKIFEQIAAGNLPFGSYAWLTAAGILIFMGAVGKSAQFPLHLWLPDAMEGPTPVSALIHAATMVAAGVYLVARVFVMLTADALLFIAVIGAITSFIAATIAFTQNDIKKVLAYSTVSQLGYMIMALGVGAYAYAFFHLVTHAFFKACMFLGSGSVIHAMHHEQDIRQMGGLRKKLPITYWTFLIATLAISGVPFTSGFLSKDGILLATLAFGNLTGHWLIPIIAYSVAGMTAFYMFRLIYLVFWGEPRNQHKYDHAHESPAVMTIPLIVLSALSIFWWYSLNPIDPSNGVFLEKVKTPNSIVPDVQRFQFMINDKAEKIGEYITHSELYMETLHHFHYTALLMSLVLAGLGIFFATYIYKMNKVNPDEIAEKIKLVYLFSLNKWYLDEFVQKVFVNSALKFSKALAWFDLNIVDGIVNGSAFVLRNISALSGWIDKYIVDGLVNFVADMTSIFGRLFTQIQTGKVQNYVLYAIFSVVILFTIIKLF